MPAGLRQKSPQAKLWEFLWMNGPLWVYLIRQSLHNQTQSRSKDNKCPWHVWNWSDSRPRKIEDERSGCLSALLPYRPPDLPLGGGKHLSDFGVLNVTKLLRQNFSVPNVWCLTHLGRVTHICTSSDNGLSPGRHQAIMWTDAGIL